MTSLERALRGVKNDWRLHLLSVFSAAVAFVCLGSALLVVVNVDGVRQRWASTGRASVYLEPGATAEQISAIEKALRGSYGVVEVKRVSSEEARRELIASGSDPVLDALPVEAFPASLEVTLTDDDATGRLEKMTAQLDALPAVDSVETYRAWSRKLSTLLTGGVSAALLLAVVVFGAVASVVSSTIRLSLQRRRIEVEVLKLVGATDRYVRQPFVIEGAAQGGVAAVLALAILGVIYGVMRGHLDGEIGVLLGMSPRFLPWFVALPLVLLGAALGAASAHMSLRRLLEA
jgi:cell division transport system permease protein